MPCTSSDSKSLLTIMHWFIWTNFLVIIFLFQLKIRTAYLYRSNKGYYVNTFRCLPNVTGNKGTLQNRQVKCYKNNKDEEKDTFELIYDNNVLPQKSRWKTFSSFLHSCWSLVYFLSFLFIYHQQFFFPSFAFFYYSNTNIVFETAIFALCLGYHY